MTSLRIILSNLRYFAPAWVFCSLNIITGTWVLYIPYIKEKFSLSDGTLGMALFAMSVGILLAVSITPWINQRIGIGRATMLGIFLFSLCFNIPLWVPSYWTLCLSLFTVGIFIGICDVSVNALTSTIEQIDNQHFMAAAHGFFSIGGVIGAGIGTLVFLEFPNTRWLMLFMSATIIVSNLYLAKNYLTVHREQSSSSIDSKMSLHKIKLLLGLSIISFIIMFNEGSVEHWSNLYLYEVVSVELNQAGLGFILFSVTMTIGRFYGDRISQSIGSFRIILLGSAVGLIGYLFVLTTRFPMVIAGYGVLGLGLSGIIPELFRLAGKTPGVRASVGISIVSGIGFLGLLFGPVVLGFISNGSNLWSSFLFLSISLLLALLIMAFRVTRMKKG